MNIVMESKRAGYLLYFICFTYLYLLPKIGLCEPAIRIVENGQPKARIVVPVDVSKQVHSAATTLQSYIEKSTGAKLPITIKSVNEAYRNDQFANIWLGNSVYAQSLNLGLNELDVDGFVIAFPENKNIVVAGSTDWGTEFGIYEFLERYLGIRWLLPGPNGEHIPKATIVDIPVREIREVPAFLSRNISGLKGNEQSIWARRHRWRWSGHIKFSHNLHILFPYQIYCKTHPAFFPVIGGKHYCPSEDKPWDWQPCFLAPGIEEEAVQRIKLYFSEHPLKTSFSLGINDSGKWCESDLGPEANRKKNYRGFWNYSNAYFQWANAVVEKVNITYPNKMFGFLAASRLAEPPTGHPINPHIIPFITYDRMKWIDSTIEKQLKEVHEKWEKKVSFLGWYDFIYGTPYCLPRVYFHEMADYYRYGYEHGVRAIYSEAYPNWGEGPKLYVALKLQWNPYQDVDKLLDDWYISAVGEEAAVDLSAYYKYWEHFWTRRIPHSEWFNRDKIKSGYLWFHYPDYMDLVSYEDISKSRHLLESVVSKAHTEKQRARANLLLRAFEYYEASAISYMGLVRGLRHPTVGKTIVYYEAMNEKRLKLVNTFERDPVLVHPRRFDKKNLKKLMWGKMLK